MRIAQVAPLLLPVPPTGYGGVERVISYLTEDLVQAGHHVTLFASGDSVTRGHLEPVIPHALGLEEETNDLSLQYEALTKTVLDRASEFDVLHFHMDPIHLHVLAKWAGPALATIHMPPQTSWEVLFRDLNNLAVVNVSDHQKALMPYAQSFGRIYNGIPINLFQRLETSEDQYLAFLGSISNDKGAHNAIAIAAQCGMPLKLAARCVSATSREYFQQFVKPFIRSGICDWIGEISDREKPSFLSRAKALLMPIEFDEPFGLVMIEAMACGVPVIAFRRGAVPEIVEEGVTGFIVDDVEGAIKAIDKLHWLSSDRIRDRFEQRFSAKTMAHGYMAMYEVLVAR
jgi:glycosyltransferase involved in cell wall biosynthesis